MRARGHRAAANAAVATRATWAMHVAARRALGAATKLLGEAGVPSLAVKGVVTAYGLYEEPTERPIGDVDVRIRPEDFGRAARCRSRGRGPAAQIPRCRSTTAMR